MISETAAFGPAPRLAWGRWALRTVAFAYLFILIVLPLSSVFHAGFAEGLTAFWSHLRTPTAWSALRLTVVLAAVTTAVNTVMGTATAFVLVRIPFPGRHLLNGFVDLPFAIPTLVTGLMLVVLYGPQGIIGQVLEGSALQLIFAKPGIVMALLLTTYPFVVRSTQPSLIELEPDQEEAAYTLGASHWTAFWKIVLPSVLPGILTGSLLTFARAVGEFGSVVIVAGNIPGQTLTAPVYVYGQIESDNAQGAAAMSILLLVLSFSLILLVDRIQRRKGVGRAGR